MKFFGQGFLSGFKDNVKREANGVTEEETVSFPRQYSHESCFYWEIKNKLKEDRFRSAFQMLTPVHS